MKMMTKRHPLAEIFDASSMIEYIIKLVKENRCPFCYITLKPTIATGTTEKDLVCEEHGAIFHENYLEEIRKTNDEIFEAVTDMILNYECFDHRPLRDLLTVKKTLLNEREGTA